MINTMIVREIIQLGEVSNFLNIKCFFIVFSNELHSSLTVNRWHVSDLLVTKTYNL